MKFERQITIGSKVFEYVDTQRDGTTAIYKDDSTYLRIGNKERIEKDLSFHKRMESYSFPVPNIYSEGIIDEMSFFIEESLGAEHFGNIFKEETEKFGKIQNETFEQFIEICIRFTEAQLKTVTDLKDWKSFKQGIHLDILCKELPDKKEEIMNAYKQIEERLNVFPFVLTHGDMTPFNMYPKGMIDFEDSFMGPAGYDLGSIIEHLNWFPESHEYEYYKLYTFTPEQKKKLTDAIDSVYIVHNLPKVSDYLADFDLAKGIWFAIRMDHTPLLQKFRYELINSLV